MTTQQPAQKSEQMREGQIKAQQSIGITRINFNHRFLYDKNVANDNFLIDKFQPTPSQMQGISLQSQKRIGYLMGEFIFKAGQSLKIPVSTAVVAASIAYYFYSRKSYIQYDFREVSMGAMFLACKSQQTLRKSYQVAAVFDYIFKVFEGQRHPIKVLELNSFQYEFMKSRVFKMENEILFELGFQVYRLFDIPHRYIGGLLKSFDKHQKSIEICQKAWTYLNDFYKIGCSLHYPGQTIAAAAVYMALLKLNINMPPVAWWILMQCNLQSIEQQIIELEVFYELANGKQYNLEYAGKVINYTAQKFHGLVNVFPVNYYRKIMLENSNQLKIPKIQQPQPKQDRTDIYTDLRQSFNERKQKKKDKKSKNKKLKKEKKSKHKKKKSNDSRSRSRDRKSQNYRSQSSSKNVASSNSDVPVDQNKQIRNNDLTPKKMVEEHVIKENNEEKEIQKKVVKQMQVSDTKNLLSKISHQLKRHQMIKQKKEQSEDSDEDLVAQLLKIKQSKMQKESEKL